MLKPEEVTQAIQKEIQKYDTKLQMESVGYVLQVGDGIARVYGLDEVIVRKGGVRVREQNFRLANEMLVALMGSQQDNVKLAAIKELLDRVEGHPKDRIELSKINFKDMEPGDRWEFIPYEMQLALARNQYPDAKAAIIKKWLADGEPAVGNSSLADEQD